MHFVARNIFLSCRNNLVCDGFQQFLQNYATSKHYCGGVRKHRAFGSVCSDMRIRFHKTKQTRQVPLRT